MLPKPTSKPALDWYPLAHLLYRELMHLIQEGLEEDLEFFLPYSEDLTLEEHGWANTFSDSAYRCRIGIYFLEDSTVFCWTDEFTGGDEHTFDLNGSYMHSRQEWGTSQKFDDSFQEWFDGAASIYEQGIVLLMNSIPTHHFSHGMDLSEVSLRLLQRKWAH